MADEATRVGAGVQQAVPGGGNPASPSPAPASGAPAVSVSPSAASPAGVSGGGGAAGAAVESQAQQAASAGAFVEFLRGMGYQLPQDTTDDRARQAVQAMLTQAQQAQQLAQYGQMYVQHADQFQRFLEAEKQRQEAERAKADSWWNAPEWNPEWRNKLQFDQQTGEIRALPGSDPSIVQKYIQAMEFRQNFMDRFTQNPIEAIKPGIEQVVKEIAGQLIQQSVGGLQDQAFAQGFLKQHEGWVWERDPQGGVVRDPRHGGPMLSQWGQQLYHYLDEAKQMGIGSEASRADYAITKIQRDFLMLQSRGQGQQTPVQQTQPALSPGQQAKAEFLAQAAGAAPGSAAPAPVAAGVQHQSNGVPAHRQRGKLEERLAKAFAVNGITDDMIRRSLLERQ